MPDDPQPPKDGSTPPPNTSDTSDTSDAPNNVILSFLEHLAKRRHAPDADTTDTTDAPIDASDAPPDAPDAPDAPPDAPDAPTDAPEPAPWAPADGNVVNLDEIRRLRQQAADAGLPDNPLLRYLFEHLMPSYHGGPVNLEVRPEFLQEHARPLVSLLLQSVADSLDRKRAVPDDDADDADDARAAQDTAQDAKQDTAPSAPAPGAGPTAATVEVKKSVSFNLDLSGIFRQLFSRKPPDDGAP